MPASKEKRKKNNSGGSLAGGGAVFVCLASFLLGIFLSLASPVLAAPGSSSDPLVSVSWVDNYIDNSFDELEVEIDGLSKRLDSLQNKHITLYIGNATALINDRQVAMDAPPTLVKGYTMLPLRFIGEALGVAVSWDSQSKTVICDDGKVKVSLPLAGKTATINGAGYALPAAPLAQNGRILAPARFIAEAFSCRVDWLAKDKRVDIY